MARKKAPTTGEDTTALPAEAKRVEDSLYRTPRISDMLMMFNGSKKDLISAIVADKVERNEKGANKESVTRSVNRWLAFESGTPGKQARNPLASKGTRGLFDRLTEKQDMKGAFSTPPGDMSVTIKGDIGYAEDVRYRTISFTVPQDLVADILAKSKEDPSAGYRDLMSAYFRIPQGQPTPITVYQGASVDFSF
jgi:hypothetical protein